ncbi:hypothetical protein D3C85_1538250 [compost metagenome]
MFTGHLESLAGGLPIGDVAVDEFELITRRQLARCPFILAGGIRAAADDDFETFLVQALTNCRANSTHTASNQRNTTKRFHTVFPFYILRCRMGCDCSVLARYAEVLGGDCLVSNGAIRVFLVPWQKTNRIYTGINYSKRITG